MGSYARKVKRKALEKEKAPRCCGRHMVMNKYGVYQCMKCGRQKFNINAALNDEPVIANEVTTNDEAPDTTVTDEIK